MPERSHRITRIITRMAAVVATLVAISLPLGYTATVYDDISQSLSFKAMVKANGLSSLIANAPDTWMFAQNRLQGLVSREPVPLDNELVRVFDQDSQLVLQSGITPLSPLLVRSYPLYDAGRAVGKIEVSGSLRPLVLRATMVSLLGLLLGTLVFVAVRSLPLRALRRVLGELFEEKERAETTLQAISDAVISTDAHTRIRYLNRSALRLLDTTPAQATGQPIAMLVHLRDDASHVPLGNLLTQALAEKTTLVGAGNSELYLPDRMAIAVEEYAAPIFNEYGQIFGGVMVLRDVSLARAYTQQRAWEASHDILTGLFNRREFENCVKTAMQDAQTSEKRHVICILDLDDFKVVNDSGGHAAGDQLLIQVAQLLRSRISDSDTLARLGGDEFGVLMKDCSLDRAKHIAEDMQALIKEFRLAWESRVYSVGVSVGLTTITAEHLTPAEAMGEADSACYWAKENGRNRIRIFLPTDMHLALRRAQTDWVTRIRAAFDQNRFVLYQQPFLRLNPADQLNEHLEILLRMTDENGSLIEPGNFLPAAERHNLMPELDRWVVREVFSYYPQLLADRGDQPVTCAINLSGASINTEGFFEFVQEQFALHQLGPGAICFELTESVAIDNLQAAVQFIRQCQSIGIEFAIDDFGIGHSSLGYLKSLPVDYLKIDGGFIRNIEHDKTDRSMTETINQIGHILGKKTIAEHAENEAIIDILRGLGIDYAQGHGVCQPHPLRRRAS